MRNENTRELFEILTPTEEQEARMLRGILARSEALRAPVSGGARRSGPARFPIVPAVVCLALLVTTAAAAATLRWDEALIEFLRPTEEQMQHLAGASDTPLATVTQNGVTVSVKQTLADSRGVYALYEISVPPEIELNDDILFDFDFLSLPLEDNAESLGVNMRSKTLKQSAHARSALVYAYTASDGEIANNKKLKLTLRDLGYYENATGDDDGLRFHPLIEGEWALEWDFSYDDGASKRIDLNREVSFNGKDVHTLEYISISPMALFMRVEGAAMGPGYRGPVIEFKDGSTVRISRFVYVDANAGTSGVGFAMRGSYTFVHCFDRITDPDEVKRVTIGDTVIPFEQF
ncbi:MAG: DUF4179 domain-containing protein [Clostridiales Family XIII bacterium]|nr:DUF4179 domain-containing protein [Clostridiales Family XIII bacterium]